MYKYFKREMNPNMPKRPLGAFFIFMEVFRKEFNQNNPNNKRVAAVGKAAGERWRTLSESDKAPYVLKAQKLRAEYDEKVLAYVRRLKKRVEDGILYEFEEFDMSVADESEFDMSEPEKFKFDKLESDKFEPDKSESEINDNCQEKSKIAKVDFDNIKKETEEVEFKTNHLEELANLLSVPLENMLQPANLIRLQNILKQVKALPLLDGKLREWCDTFLEVTKVMPRQRIGTQKVLMETEAKAQTIIQLRKEATDIKKTTLQVLELKKEYSTSIQSLDAKVENLKRQLAEAEAERATLIRLEEDLAATEFQRSKKARIVHDDLALLIGQNEAINKIILDSRIAIANIDCHLNTLVAQFNVLKNAAN